MGARKLNWLGIGVAAAVGLAGVGMASSASAAAFMYTFTGTDGQTAKGWITATLVSPGEYEATSGNISAKGPLETGNGGSLFPNPSPPGQSTSPSGFFNYDNQVLPSSDPLLDNDGLLFTMKNGDEVNIFSVAPDNYQFYVNNGGNDFGSFSLTAVPEPATWAITILGLGMIGAGLRMSRRKTDETLVAA